MANLSRPPNTMPPPIRTYTGSATPAAYDPNWQYFTNLTPDQIAWFQAQPEWQNFLSYRALSPKTTPIGVPVAVVNSALQAVNKTLAITAKPIGIS